MLAELNLKPSDRVLRQFGVIAFVAFELFAVRGRVSSSASYVLAGAGVLFLLFSFLWPGGNRPLYVALTVLTYPIGWIVSQLVLAFLFFGLLTPVAVLFRLVGRDPLERKLDRKRGSYWTDLPESIEERDYFRQF